jgi:hypothetical protein
MIGILCGSSIWCYAVHSIASWTARKGVTEKNMAKATDPRLLTDLFPVNPDQLRDLGVLNPTLSIDTKLFIDPLLLRQSQHPEIREQAVAEYTQHFEQVIALLAASTRVNDIAWRNARRHMSFHEIKGTCLGYGSASISGSGFGPQLTERVIGVGKEIVDLGIRDPDLFAALALFEASIGPDRLSDMTTNVIRAALISFNQRILQTLNIAGEHFDFGRTTGNLLPNPCQSHRTPIILVPLDILRELPIAKDWDDVADAASKNAALRDRVNQEISHIWATKTRRDQERLKSQALSSQAAFQTLLDAIHSVPLHAYNSNSDPEGTLSWSQLARRFAEQYPLQLKPVPPSLTIDHVFEIVRQIISRFRQLIEQNGLNRELYREDRKPRHESTAQRLFFAVAYCYCEANNLDLSPEIDTGSGKVDFKCAGGFDSRVLVEVKLSTNPNLVHGYETQLEIYKTAQQTMRAFYLVINVGHIGRKDRRLGQLRQEAFSRGEPLSELEFVSGRVLASASRR